MGNEHGETECWGNGSLYSVLFCAAHERMEHSVSSWLQGRCEQPEVNRIFWEVHQKAGQKGNLRSSC